MRHGSGLIDIAKRIDHRAELLSRGLPWDETDETDINSGEQAEIEAARKLHEHRQSHELGAWCHQCAAAYYVPKAEEASAPL